MSAAKTPILAPILKSHHLWIMILCALWMLVVLVAALPVHATTLFASVPSRGV